MAFRMETDHSGVLTPIPPTMVFGGAQQDDQLSGSETPRGHVGVSDLTGALQTKLEKLQAQTDYDEDKLLKAGRYMCQKSGADEVMKVVLQEGNATSDQFLGSISPRAAAPTPVPPKPHEVPRPGKALFAASNIHVISRGSVGHPQTCAAACKHVKRKGGCKNGADCPQCHECFWVKDSTTAESPAQIGMRPNKTEEEPPEISVSAGSLNHPHGCGQACKHVRRKGGCRDGQSCANCHFCQWTRQGKKQMPSDQSSFVLNLDELVPESTPPVSLAAEIAAAANFLIPKNPPPGLMTPTTTSMPQLSVLGVHGAAPQSQSPQPPLELVLSVGSTGHPYSCGAACKYAKKTKGCKDGVNCERCHLCHWSRYTKTEKIEETMGSDDRLFTLGNIVAL